MNLIFMQYIFIISFGFSFLFAFLIKKIAARFKIVDNPDKIRKLHESPVPLLGGVAVFASFFLVLYFFRSEITAGNLGTSHWLGFFLGGLLIMIGGFLDDKYNLKPGQQLIFPILAAIAVVAGGVEILKLTNPFGGYLHLDAWRIPLFAYGSTTYFFVVFSDFLVFLWLMGMMYTTKILDGVDGLVSGVVAIGAMIIFLFTTTTLYFQPDISLAALILAAACLGFLALNWHPAKIFLGEGGSLFLGYALGVLAIISGGKIAIALLVMAIPILDVIWTIVRRLAAGKNPFRFADRKHLHFRLLDSGLGPRKTVLIYYFIAGAFGICALFLQSIGKVFALLILIAIMIFLIVLFGRADKKLPR